MRSANFNPRKLSALLKRLGSRTAAPAGAPQLHGGRGTNSAAAADPIAAIVFSSLLWEASTDKAVAAYHRLMSAVVDFNDLRVCMPHETLELIGPRYPRALDRCQRLRAVLRNVYLREHAVNLNRLPSVSKREVKKYIESLEGIVPYVCARVLLLSFGIHGIPVDDQLRTLLIEASVADASVEIPELSHWLAAHVKPDDGAAVHGAFQAWVDESVSRGAERRIARRPASPRGASARRSSREGAKASA